MDSIQLLLLSVSLFGAGALASLLLNGFVRVARYVSGVAGIIAATVGVAAVIRAFVSPTRVLVIQSPLPFGAFSLTMDGLAAFMVGVICILGFAASLYSIPYLEKYENRSLGVMGFFTNIFIAMMLLVVTVSNAFYFLIFWETMTLASYFLVIFEGEKKESIQAGYLYMVVAHTGTALIMLSFLLFFLNAGSFEFSSFRSAQLSPTFKSVAFLLAFLGFGAKAGMVPLHIWLPRAHPAAPSHISALMSGVMIKTAIYGILRVCVDFLGASILWWGVVVLFFGVISAVLGVLYALTERDIKRMLAYSSVENIGIILIGVGVGMIGLAINDPVVTLLGFLAALYHILNHTLFKGLLFLGAGSVDFQVHTRNLNEMGGLARRMPWTALTFLAGALAVSSIPPLNGFVSEWILFQSLISAGESQIFSVRAIAPLSAMVLAMTGALAAMCFIKAYGGAFTGPARSERASQSNESPGLMVASMVFLALGCLAFGLGAPYIAPSLVGVAASFSGISPLPVAAGVWIFPVEISQALLSPPLILIILLGMLVVPVAVVAIYDGRKAGRRIVDAPWSCGYGYSPEMSVSASSFDQPVKITFRVFYSLRLLIDKPLADIARWSRQTKEKISAAEPVLERVIVQPVTRLIDYLGSNAQRLQMGDIRMYCLYIILTLAILLIVIFR